LISCFKWLVNPLSDHGQLRLAAGLHEMVAQFREGFAKFGLAATICVALKWRR